MQFPALGAKQDADHGSGHMIEVEDTDTELPNIETDNQVPNKHLSDPNVLQQKLVESEA